jgi:hypothetical protein
MAAPEVKLIKIFRYRADPIDTVQMLEIVFRSSAFLAVTNSGCMTFRVLHSNSLMLSCYFMFRLG